MKKIYSKFVKDRKKEFQIETALWDDEGKRKVSKRKLYADGQTHIDTIIDTYQMYTDSGLVCGLEESDDKIFFEYIDGITFERQLIDALKESDKTKTEELVGRYNKIVDEICAWNKGSAKQKEIGFESVFGDKLFDVEGEPNIIFDLTFDNVIFDGASYKVIDYEWRFEFPLEKEFVKFRAVYAFVMKCKGLIDSLYSVEEFYDLFFVSLENQERYLEYNNNFIKYVYGTNGYNDVIKKYEKRSIDVFNEESVNALRVLHNRKIAEEESFENMFFHKILESIENNKDYYDDYTKFYRVTKKVQELNPNGYTESKEFVEEFSVFIDDLYGMVSYYKNDVGEYYNQQLAQLNHQLEQSNQQVYELNETKLIVENELRSMTEHANRLSELLDNTLEWKLRKQFSKIKRKVEGNSNE